MTKEEDGHISDIGSDMGYLTMDCPSCGNTINSILAIGQEEIDCPQCAKKINFAWFEDQEYGCGDVDSER